MPQQTVSFWLNGHKLVGTPCFIIGKNGEIAHNSGAIAKNLSHGHPKHPLPLLLCAKAESLPLPSSYVDLIITSPPYNLGAAQWDMGGNNYMNGHGRLARKAGIGYTAHDDAMPEGADSWSMGGNTSLSGKGRLGHAERLRAVETMQHTIEAWLSRIDDKLNRLIER